VINCLREFTTASLAIAARSREAAIPAPRAPYWEVQSSPAAPEIAQFIDAQSRMDKLSFMPADHELSGERIEIEIACRDRKSGAETCLSINRIINCTAPLLRSRQAISTLDPFSDSS